MPIIRRILIIIFSLLSLIAGTAWLYADQLLNDLLRPQIEQLAARTLEADVAIESLRWTSKGVDLIGLRLALPTGIKLAIAKLETEFSLSGLFRRRFNALQIIRPQLEIDLSAAQEDAPQAQNQILPELPLQIERLTLIQGDLLLHLGDRQIHFREITLAGALTEQFPYRLSALIGPGAEHPMTISGRIELNATLSLTLDQLEFQRRPLIARPLTLNLAGSASDQGRISLLLARFDQDQLGELLFAFGVDTPVPEELHFVLEETQVDLDLQDPTGQIDLSISAGVVAQGEIEIPFGKTRVGLARSGEYWSAEAELTELGTTQFSLAASYTPQAKKSAQFSLALRLGGKEALSAAGNPDEIGFALGPVSLAQLAPLLPLELIPKDLKSLESLTATGLIRAREQAWSGEIAFAAKGALLSDIQLSEVSGQATLEMTSQAIFINDFQFKSEIARGEEISARIDTRFSAELKQKQFTASLKRLNFSQINYLSADGQTGLSDARIELRGSLSADLQQEQLIFKLAGSALASEILSGEFYADLAPFKNQFELQGNFAIPQQTLQLEALQLEIPLLGTAKFSGRVNPTSGTLSGSLALPDLAGAYGENLGPLLADFRPVLAGLTLEGALEIVSDVHWSPAGWHASGELQPQGLDAFWAQQELELVDGRGKIPFALSTDQTVVTQKSQTEQTGEISFASLSIGLASLEAGILKLAASPNHFAFRSPLRLALAGGLVAIDDLSLGWEQGVPSGSVRIQINNVDLKTLTKKLKLPLMQGTFTGDLGLIEYSDNQLRTTGTAALDIFGGNFSLRNMRYDSPFSAYPVFSADLDFSGIDLLQATRTFAFGEMNGIIDGQVHGLRLFGAIPSAFEARLETRGSGKRNISVKALNNLSIISQGGISAALSQGLYRFIDFYRYRKIGFACALGNDTFTLIGTAHPDSTRYLVAGSLLPPRIDITTSTPTISFKEMVQRLNRIDRAGN